MFDRIRLYINESYDEIRTKMTWPTLQNLQSTTGVVLLASLFLAILIFLMDSSANQILKIVYGIK